MQKNITDFEHSAHRGFRYGYKHYKGNTFTLNTALFGW